MRPWTISVSSRQIPFLCPVIIPREQLFLHPAEKTTQWMSALKKDKSRMVWTRSPNASSSCTTLDSPNRFSFKLGLPISTTPRIDINGGPSSAFNVPASPDRVSNAFEWTCKHTTRWRNIQFWPSTKPRCLSPSNVESLHGFRKSSFFYTHVYQDLATSLRGIWGL